MKTKNRIFAPTAGAVVASACLFALAGCQSRGTSGDGHGDEEEHAAHVIPAHKPKTFPDAVHRLRELNDQFFKVGVAPTKEPSTGPSSLQIALDIANWLPEIAADSDMPEAPWNEVNARSARLVADYQELLAGAGNARIELDHANAEIGSLEKVLLASDPRWFEGVRKVAAAPR